MKMGTMMRKMAKMKTMKKLRLLLFEECPRSCKGCCNKDWDLGVLPIVKTFEGYDEIILTGGEPMLRPQLVITVAQSIKQSNPSAAVYMYTACLESFFHTHAVLEHLDGMTVTLHEQKDVEGFEVLNKMMLNHLKKLSLRLNVFKGVNITGIDTSSWKVKDDIEWIKDCPLPEDEEFMRLRRR